jgi:diguanylate cyclase (GGDEF)-like protein
MFKFLEKVIMESKTPVLPPEYAKWDTFNSLYQHTSEIKNALGNFAKGDLDLRLVKKGATSGSLKAILANLSHLAWQFKVAASGDYSHTVDFMGDFSEAFNLMTSSLRRHEMEIHEKQNELALMAEELKKEIHRRDQFEAALKESEKNYRNQALRDPLTHIYNRIYFNEAGKREVELTRREGASLCLLMIDLDHFKKFNDNYGHLSGDAALIHVTKIISELKRNTDIFARHGGEEFALLLPQTNFAGGLSIAERIRNEVAARHDPAPNCNAPITISVGLASLTQEEALSDRDASEEILRKLLVRAEEGLYMGKKRGRNQVCWVGMEVGQAFDLGSFSENGAATEIDHGELDQKELSHSELGQGQAQLDKRPPAPGADLHDQPHHPHCHLINDNQAHLNSSSESVAHLLPSLPTIKTESNPLTKEPMALAATTIVAQSLDLVNLSPTAIQVPARILPGLGLDVLADKPTPTSPATKEET